MQTIKFSKEMKDIRALELFEIHYKDLCPLNKDNVNKSLMRHLPGDGKYLDSPDGIIVE